MEFSRVNIDDSVSNFIMDTSGMIDYLEKCLHEQGGSNSRSSGPFITPSIDYVMLEEDFIPMMISLLLIGDNNYIIGVSTKHFITKRIKTKGKG